MARRKEHTHEQIKQMAIVYVQEYLLIHSLESLSLRKIALEIGYVPSTLINIFGSYQYLLLAVSQETLMALQQQLIHAVTLHSQGNNKALDPLTHLIVMAKAYNDFAQRNVRCFRLVFELTLEESDPLPKTQSDVIQTLFDQIESLLVLLQPNLDVKSLEVLSRTLWGGIHGLTCLGLDGKLFTHHVGLDELLTNHVRSCVIGMDNNKEKLCC